MKDRIDKLCDLMVFGTLFCDELESYKENKFFRYGMKKNVNSVLNEKTKGNDKLFNGLNNDNKRSLTYAFDINYEILSKINKLPSHEKDVFRVKLDDFLLTLKK